MATREVGALLAYKSFILGRMKRLLGHLRRQNPFTLLDLLTQERWYNHFLGCSLMRKAEGDQRSTRSNRLWGYIWFYLEYHNQWGNKKALYTLQSFILSCYYGISMKNYWLPGNITCVFFKIRSILITHMSYCINFYSELFLSLYHEIGSLYKWLVILCLPSGFYRELGALWS